MAIPTSWTESWLHPDWPPGHRQVTLGPRFPLYDGVALPGWQVMQRWMEMPARHMLGAQAFVSASPSFLSSRALVRWVTQITEGAWAGHTGGGEAASSL